MRHRRYDAASKGYCHESESRLFYLDQARCRKWRECGFYGIAGWRDSTRQQLLTSKGLRYARAMRLLVGMVGAANHGADGGMGETHLVGFILEHLECIRMHVAAYR